MANNPNNTIPSREEIEHAANDIKEIKKNFEKFGFRNLDKFLEEKLEKWKDTKLNIAVIGQSGSGKSSLVNSLRGLKYRQNTSEDKNIAKTGPTEEVIEPTDYQYPGNPNLKIWDCPGGNTRNFRMETYLEAINFKKYDCFIICCASRFLETDEYLAKEVKKAEKNFYFVRTHVDKDIDNEADSLDKNELSEQEEQECLAEIRNKIFKEVKEFNNKYPIYLLSTNLKYANKWDFQKLIRDILRNLSDEKAEAFIRSITNFGKETIKTKCAHLRKGIGQIAKLSAVVGLIPIPGTSLAVDLALVVTEIIIFRETLGLDIKSLEIVSMTNNIELYKLIQIIEGSFCGYLCLKSMGALITGLELLAFLSVNTAEEFFKLIPVLGSIFGSVTSYFTVRLTLNKILDAFEELAIKILETIAEIQKSKLEKRD